MIESGYAIKAVGDCGMCLTDRNLPLRLYALVNTNTSALDLIKITELLLSDEILVDNLQQNFRTICKYKELEEKIERGIYCLQSEG